MRSVANIKGHPIHPVLVAFPIGLWVASFLFDAIGTSTTNSLLWAAGFYAIIAGCIGAALAAAAGVADLLGSVPPNSSAKKRGYIHGGLNAAVLLMYIYIAWRRGGPWDPPDGVAILISGLGVLMLAASGWLGGTLVYNNQIGVDRRYANAGRQKIRTLSGWEKPVCNPSELSDGQLMLAIVGNERVAVGRCGEGIFAFADHCTHRGGPLSDGALVGCTVQCPWHGSQFDITTGRVIAGPAEEKIKLYEVEIRRGEVYVQAKRPKDETKAA